MNSPTNASISMVPSISASKRVVMPVFCMVNTVTSLRNNCLCSLLVNRLKFYRNSFVRDDEGDKHQSEGGSLKGPHPAQVALVR